MSYKLQNGVTFYLYVKQDGMYNSKEILLTDEYTPLVMLPKDWYIMENNSETVYRNLSHLFWNIKESLMKSTDVQELVFRTQGGDTIITKKEIEEMNPEYFI